jgi:DNA-binding transcriptional MerR regulator
MEDGNYSIQELCDQTGLPRRTIHFYVQQGLLPPPSGAGLGATYHETHLLRLQLIPFLRQDGLRLDDIRERFQSLKLPDLRRLYDQSKESFTPPPSPLPAGRSYTHYHLPAGMTLITPTALSQADRKKITQLLQEVQRIWGEKPPRDEDASRMTEHTDLKDAENS